MKNKRVINEMIARFKEYTNLKKAGPRELVRRVLLLGCIVAFVVYGYQVVEKWYDDYINRVKYSQMVNPNENKSNNNVFDKQEEDAESFKLIDMLNFSGISSSYANIISQAESGDKMASNGAVIGEGFLSYLEANGDTVGFISIEGTNVNYPVVLNKEDNEFYLKRNFEKAKANAAAIYMDYRNRPYSEDQNTVIYGHNMGDKSMFGTLSEFAKEEFAREHIYISYNTLYETMTWEVFAVYKINWTTGFKYTQVSFNNDEEYAKNLANCKKASIVKFDANPGIYDRILTLSTCTSGNPNSVERFVVQAMLVSRNPR